MRQKGGGPRRKIWKASKGVWKPCNPLKSHKTAKDLFGKAWSKTREFWRSLEKGLEGAFIPPPLAPATSSLDRAGSSLRGAKLRPAKLRSNPGGGKKEKKGSQPPAPGRAGAGAEPAMTEPSDRPTAPRASRAPDRECRV